MTITLVAAVADNGVIGRDGDLPWRLPDDLRHFKRLTLGRTIIMGRRTFESYGGHPLPRRRSIVVTRNPDYPADGVEVVPSLEQALALAKGEEEIFVIGGEGIFREAMPLADRMVLTHVHATPEGDTRFPEVDWSQWETVGDAVHPADDRHAHAFTFRDYRRRGGVPVSRSASL